MGIFGNNQTREFKDKMADVFNLISNFSYGDLPMSMASTIEATIESNYRQLKSLYNRFPNPFGEYFNYYTSFTSAFGTKVSVAEGMYIVYLAKELAFQGNRMSERIHQQMMLEARMLFDSSSGRQKIMSAINNS